jgi:hypothetical protein
LRFFLSPSAGAGFEVFFAALEASDLAGALEAVEAGAFPAVEAGLGAIARKVLVLVVVDVVVVAEEQPKSAPRLYTHTLLCLCLRSLTVC